MEKDKLKEIFLDQRDYFLEKKELIQRDIDLTRYLQTKQIVLISGIRRSGKSSLLYLIKNELNLDEKNVLYFNFDDERLGGFKVEDFNQIYELQLELLNSDKKNLVMFLDEIQNFDGWEKFLNRMYEKKIKIFVTGSNAKLLSSEMGTFLTGRNMVLSLFPFSFKEFLKFNNLVFNLDLLSSERKAKLLSNYNNYLKYGGFPLVVEEKNTQLVKSYYQDILYRDIIARFNISQIEEIKILGSYLATNLGKLVSYSTLKEVSRLKSLSTLKNYVDYFENSFLFYFLKKYDYSIKKQILNPRKVYVSDLVFSSEIGFKFSEDKGRILENLVFIELKRIGYEIYYHKNKKECDFVIKEKLKISKAIQVTISLSNSDTKKREVAGLLDACFNYKLKEGLILTEDEESEFEEKGIKIKVMPIWKWLLSDVK